MVRVADLIERIFVSNNETIWNPSGLSGKCGEVPKSLGLLSKAIDDLGWFDADG